MTQKFLYAVVAAVGAVQSLLSYSPVIDGALADVRLTVVDDVGSPVPNATVSIAFYVKPSKSENQTGLTDAEGRFTAKGRCIGEAKAWIRKDGHYDTRIEPHFQTLPDDEVKKARKWSGQTVETTVTLKRKRHPIQVIFHNDKDRICYPATNEVVGFDLALRDWCRPYGKGEYDDLQVKYNFWRSPTNWLQVYSSLDISMTNKLDGFYFEKTEPFSKLPYLYEANTNAVYQKNLHLEYDRRTGVVKSVIDFPENSYPVFRTRTKVDPKGRLVSANYGFALRRFEYGVYFRLRYLFNPTPNDTNLEDPRAW